MCCAAAPAPKKSALDKATLESYVRHLFVFNPQIQVKIGDPKPSATLPGFYDVVVTASNGAASQDFPFLVSRDGQKILQGTVFDINQNPFKADLDKLKTQAQPNIGTPGATVVLVEFSDFECGFCKEEAVMLRQNLLNAYPKQARLYFKQFPLSQIHQWAKAAAMASLCIFHQNPEAFWKFHDWIFDQQTSITAENLKSRVLDWAKGVKEIDALKLGRCMDAKETEPEVERDIAEGRALGINSTPTLFINGRRLVGRVDWNTLRNIIDYEIEYQKTAKNAGEDSCCEVKLKSPVLK
jgi:protein-disulfide isomerase